jgi:hypothetical protein
MYALEIAKPFPICRGFVILNLVIKRVRVSKPVFVKMESTKSSLAIAQR